MQERILALDAQNPARQEVIRLLTQQEQLMKTRKVARNTFSWNTEPQFSLSFCAKASISQLEAEACAVKIVDLLMEQTAANRTGKLSRNQSHNYLPSYFFLIVIRSGGYFAKSAGCVYAFKINNWSELLRLI